MLFRQLLRLSVSHSKATLITSVTTMKPSDQRVGASLQTTKKTLLESPKFVGTQVLWVLRKRFALFTNSVVERRLTCILARIDLETAKIDRARTEGAHEFRHFPSSVLEVDEGCVTL